MSDILSKFLLITEHVKTDLKNSESYPDLIFPLNALHSAMALLGFKEDNLLEIGRAHV